MSQGKKMCRAKIRIKNSASVNIAGLTQAQTQVQIEKNMNL